MNGIAGLIHEYGHLRAGAAQVDWASVRRALVREHDWTEDAASHLVSLAQEYGAFVLRNAAALAEALGVEDGDLNL